MKTIDIETELMYYFDFKSKLIVPNVTGMNNTPIMFETDLLILSDSGYATGIEIKVVKNDLKKDLNKSHIINLDKPNYKTYLNLWFKGLKQFYYAVPEELEEDALNQIPEYFGLLICKKVFNGYFEELEIEEVRKSKILFNYKWNDKERYDLARLGTMKIYGLKNKIKRLNNKLLECKNPKIIAKVNYIINGDEDFITVECLKNDSDKQIISKAQKLFRSRTNITYYGNQSWKVIKREYIKDKL